MSNPPDAAEGQVDRYVLEGFFLTRKLLPKKWAAARLGLTVPMLETILERRTDLPTPLRREYISYGVLVDQSLGEDLIRVLPGLRFRTFYDHESFCSQLHRALISSLNIAEDEMQAAILWCATDRDLGERGDYPRRFAHVFDCLTCQPLSIAHQLWLDFKKPLSLAPDRCSKLVYAANEETLKGWLAGKREPDDLERYREAVAAMEH